MGGHVLIGIQNIFIFIIYPLLSNVSVFDRGSQSYEHAPTFQIKFVFL